MNNRLMLPGDLKPNLNRGIWIKSESTNCLNAACLLGSSHCLITPLLPHALRLAAACCCDWTRPLCLLVVAWSCVVSDSPQSALYNIIRYIYTRMTCHLGFPSIWIPLQQFSSASTFQLSLSIYYIIYFSPRFFQFQFFNLLVINSLIIL